MKFRTGALLSAALGFSQVLAEQPELKGNLYFDLAQVFDAGASQADLARLVEAMRAIGIDRFVPGSDWPFCGPLTEYLNGAMARLPLKPDEKRAFRMRRDSKSARLNSPG